MALDLEGYIKQSYERPNRKILEDLGANEQLIEYLMETPGNMNWQVVESIEGAGGGDDDWTTIRLNAVELDPVQNPGFYALQGPQDEIEALLNLGTRDDVIIASSYSVGPYNNLHDIGYISANSGTIDAVVGDYVIICGQLDLTMLIGHISDEDVDYYGMYSSSGLTSADYIEIKYKTGPHCVVSWKVNDSIYQSFNMEVGQQLTTLEMYSTQFVFTDGTHTWNFGDTITINSDMILTIVQKEA